VIKFLFKNPIEGGSDRKGVSAGGTASSSRITLTFDDRIKILLKKK